MIDLAYWSYMMEQESKNKPRGNRVYDAQNDFMMLCLTASPNEDVTDLFHKALQRNGVREFELTSTDQMQFQSIADKYRQEDIC